MDFSTIDWAYPALALVLMLLLVAQNWLINRRQAWFGIFVPAAYIGLLLYLAASGRVISLTDFVFSALGLLGLVSWWASAREAKQQQKDDDDSVVITPWSAADSSVSFPPPGTGVRRHFYLGVG